jgi:protein-disulfide isomerase
MHSCSPRVFRNCSKIGFVNRPAHKLQSLFGLFRQSPRTHAGFLLSLAALLLPAPAARSQRQPTQVLDSSALHPPASARVAIVEFDDLECPACAAANPVLMQAAAKYGIPWIRHDFLIPGHPWSPSAAINARWFDLKSKRLGDDYRNYIFANQTSIETRDELQQFTQRFASAHSVALPFAIDPQGKLTAAVQADCQLGLRTGVKQTPTIFIVTANSKGAPFIEVLDSQTQLFTTIDQALAQTRIATPTKPSAKTNQKTTHK